MAGMTDLQQLLATLEPEVRDGEYVYVTEPDGPSGVLEADALIDEAEGRTLVVRREVASLGYHGQLIEVGLTAAFSTALAQAGIGCNVLAGRYHDHILVPHNRREDAVAALRALSTQH